MIGEREDLEGRVSEVDEIAAKKLTQGLARLVLGEPEKLRDAREAPETGALGAGDEDEEEVEQDLVAREIGEKAPVKEIAIDPGEAPGNGPDPVGPDGLSTVVGVWHGSVLRTWRIESGPFPSGPPRRELERCRKCVYAASDGQEGPWSDVHIGIHTRWEILEDKLELRDHPRSTKGTWQLTRLPEKLSPEGSNRLYVAVDGVWQGYFLLEDDILWNPDDRRCPYSLVFDTRSWVDIRPLRTKRFRGFTYDTPAGEEVVPTGGAGQETG